MQKKNRMADKILKSIVILAVCAMLSAMSFVLMLLEFPITPPAMGHLKMDFSDIPALFAGIIFNPVCAVIVELVKNLLELTVKGVGTQMGFGNLMNFIVGCAYVVPFSIIIRRKNKKIIRRRDKKSQQVKNILIASAAGILCIVLIGVCANYFVAPLFFKYFLGIEIDGPTLWAAVGSATALNAIKGVMLSVASFPIVMEVVDRVRKIAGNLID